MRMAFDAVADAGWFIEVGGGTVEETDWSFVKPWSCIKSSGWRNGRKEIGMIYLL